MEWIECSKQTPPAYEDVIVYFPGGLIVKAAWLPRWNEWEINSQERKSGKAILWMPIPKIP